MAEAVETHAPDSFDEEAYLLSNPDVAEAVAQGRFKSGWDHFSQHGQKEGRPLVTPGAGLREILPKAEKAVVLERSPTMARCAPEHLFISRGGGLFLSGWVDDVTDPIQRVTLRSGGSAPLVLDNDHIGRLRRSDVEADLPQKRHYPYGFWGFLAAGRALPAADYQVTVRLGSGAEQTFQLKPRSMEDAALRDSTLAYIAAAAYFGNPQVKAVAALERGLGRELSNFSKTVTRALCATPYVERFGDPARKYKGSIIVCLYGRAEYMFLQQALYAGLPGIEDYHFVYVCNSPELSEQVLRLAQNGRRIYGLDQTVALLPGNAGFGGANNVAVRYATSPRLLFVNPDVFPRDPAWARKHTDMLQSLPAAQTNLFGVSLYYEDGSLMHGGMYFDIDTLPSAEPNAIVGQRLLRVEHFGKGAPPHATKFLRPRPVAAVTGAFISTDRRWFERLGGFTEDFIFGHYEDADLCLKSLNQGNPAWFHDLKMWHLEGKGSTRLQMHDGGSLVNRWLFAATWGDLIASQLRGPDASVEQFRPVPERRIA